MAAVMNVPGFAPGNTTAIGSSEIYPFNDRKGVLIVHYPHPEEESVGLPVSYLYFTNRSEVETYCSKIIETFGKSGAN